MDIAGRSTKCMMVTLILSTALLVGNAAAAGAYQYNDISSIKGFFVTLAFFLVLLQLPFGIALYTHTLSSRHTYIKKSHRSIGYILLFVFVFTAILCMVSNKGDIHNTRTVAHVIVGVVGVVVFPLKISYVRSYGGYMPKTLIAGSILFIVFFMLFATTRL